MESYTKEEINNMFDNYYTKSETYSKQEVNNLLGVMLLMIHLITLKKK